MQIRTLISGAAIAALVGCGSMPGERALSGSAIGAGAGAVLGAVTGMSVVTGALVGAAGGALTGALTHQGQINFGEPAWKVHPNAAPISQINSQSPPLASQTVNSIQTGLSRLGYPVGPVDGIIGVQTQTAIRAYQRDHGLRENGRATPRLADHLWNHVRSYSAVNRQPG